MTDNPIRQDYENLKALLQAAQDQALSFHEGLADRSVAANYPLLTLDSLAETGAGSAAALESFQDQIAPHLSGSIGPRYLGFVTGGTTPAALAGDWLAAAVDQNMAAPGDSIATQVSLQTIGWLLDLFDLPRDEFAGTFTTGATAANLMAILSAREWASETAGHSAAADGLTAVTPLSVYSATPHASFVKMMAVAGLGRNQIIPLERLPGTEAMDPASLARELRDGGLGPKMVVASGGTVTGTDFDDLIAVAEICRDYDAWLHVDAAFGIFARCLPELRPAIAGLELADSITGDAHKWLNVPYDSGFFFTRHMDFLDKACGMDAAYLKTETEEPSFMNRSVEGSQRFRALPIWMSLKAYGREGIARIAAENCRLAAALGDWIEASPDYELLAPVKLNVVCFRGLCPGEEEEIEAHNPALLRRINATGKVYMTPGKLQGKTGIRAAFSNWMTEDADLDLIIEALQQAAGES